MRHFWARWLSRWALCLPACRSPPAKRPTSPSLPRHSQRLRSRGGRRASTFGTECQDGRAGTVKALDDKNLEVRWRSARAFGAIGPAAQSAVPGLMAHLSDPDAAVRTQCAAALGKIGVKSEDVVTALAKSITDDEPHVRRAAIAALRRLQPDRKLLIPALTQILEDSKPEAAITAMSEIADIGEQAVPGLVEALLNKQAHVTGQPSYWARLARRRRRPCRRLRSSSRMRIPRCGCKH